MTPRQLSEDCKRLTKKPPAARAPYPSVLYAGLRQPPLPFQGGEYRGTKLTSHQELLHSHGRLNGVVQNDSGDEPDLPFTFTFACVCVCASHLISVHIHSLVRKVWLTGKEVGGLTASSLHRTVMFRNVTLYSLGIQPAHCPWRAFVNTIMKNVFSGYFLRKTHDGQTSSKYIGKCMKIITVVCEHVLTINGFS